jgi:SAM-dependent methyltransferase
MLYLYLMEQGSILNERVTVLETAPRECVRSFLQSLPNVTYISSDLKRKGVMVSSDLTSMGMASESLDIIISLHVFEHIPDDHAGYAELRRLLTPNGFALVIVPLEGEKTFEDPNARPEDYMYGMDVADRMRAAGLQVEVVDMFKRFRPDVLQRYGLLGDDRYAFKLSK